RGLIGGALNSVVDWVDLCLVIDTGATDDALAVARQVAGDKYREARVPWTDDFAAARNAALAAATDLGADWTVVVDTDERLDRASVDIRQHLAETPHDVLMVFQRDGSYAKERFFRLPTNARYHGPTHEYVAADEASIGDLPGVRFREIRKCAGAYQAKFQRDVEILTRYTAEHPDDPRWFYYLGDAHHGLGQEENAIAAFMACAALRGWNEESAWACYRAAECWLILDNPIQAIDCCAMGLTRHPGLAELSWLAAYAAWRAGQFAHAAHWARLSIAAGCFAGSGCNEPRRGFRNPRALYEGPYDVLRYALRALGDEAGAERAEQEYHAAAALRVARS
ncbi:MAG: glycosyltransferase, partial [Chloroflexota bacterium]|nr:glycosyltransferase [Chloroflexota bacterium]